MVAATPSHLRRQQFTDPQMQRLFDAVYAGLVEVYAHPRHPLGDVGEVYTSGFVARFDTVELVDPTTGPVDIVLPVIKARDVGRALTIVNVTSDTNTITVLAGDGAEVDGASSVSQGSAYSSFRILAVSRTLWRWLQ